jgi:hypothetical protein
MLAQSALDVLTSHLSSAADVNVKARLATALAGCLRGGILTIHALLNALSQQLMASFKLSFKAAPAIAESHEALRAALLNFASTLSQSVDQSKRIDAIAMLQRRIVALDETLSGARLSAARALLLRAAASFAVHVTDVVSPSDSHRLAGNISFPLVLCCVVDERMLSRRLQRCSGRCSKRSAVATMTHAPPPPPYWPPSSYEKIDRMNYFDKFVRDVSGS